MKTNLLKTPIVNYPLSIVNYLLVFFLLFGTYGFAQKKDQKTTATSGTIYLNLDLANAGPGYIDIPISFVSNDSIVALDFSLKFNESVLTYQSIVNPVPYLTDVLAFFSPDDRKLRFTSNSKFYYKINTKIASVRFTVLSGIVTNLDFSELTGYLNGDKVNMEVRGTSTLYSGTLTFWLDNSPIKYNAAVPSQYLITNIYGADSNCVTNPAPAVQPNLTGQFSYNILNGSSIKVVRDILPSTDVQTVINGADANLGHKVLVNDLSFTPSVFQLIALDVNADGVVSAGDVSQINQRSVKTITEFKQKWNYNLDGTSNGQLSKDWLFINTTLLASPAYKKSITYPSNDGLGYSKSNVPVVPFCLQLPFSGSLTGILLGDVNGNYEGIAPDGLIKRSSK
jgi:hypothetical protein